MGLPAPKKNVVAKVEKRVEAAPGEIAAGEKLKLWVASGGRCAVCNDYLLSNEFTGHYLNVGEMAHNVGRKKSEGSARGREDLPLEERNKAENLLLLCDRDHKTIDHRDTRADWPVERLTAIKQEHETRIKYLTSLKEDVETVVLRVVGDVQRAGAVELSPDTVIGALRANGRYPRYKLGIGGARDVELDLRGLPSEGEELYWQMGTKAIEHRMLQITEGVRRGDIRHLSIFALARIPLLAVLGDRLDDKVDVDIYQRQRDESIGWGWDPDAESVQFEVETRQEGNDAVTLVCSLSGSVDLDKLPGEIAENAAIYEIRPIGIDPSPHVFLARDSQSAFAATYRAFLAQLERAHPGLQALNIVPAVPVAAAVEFGRARMKSKHPALRVYDLANGAYTLAVEVSS